MPTQRPKPTSNVEPKLTVSSRQQWRAWLQRNHAKAQEVWLVFFKKHAGKPTINYTNSVEEALCFGWIDGLKRRIDDQRYAYRFTPRKRRSKWSPLNIRLAKRMIAEGRMTPAGRQAFDQRIDYDEAILEARDPNRVVLTPEIEKALKANRKAWKNFNNLAPSCRRQYAGWLKSAKRPETLKRRIEEAIELLAENRKLGMK